MLIDVQASHLHRIMGGCDGSMKLVRGRPNPPPSDSTREGLAAHVVFRHCLDGLYNPSSLIGHTVHIDADGSTFVITREIIDNVLPSVEYIRKRGIPPVSTLTEYTVNWSPTNGAKINGRADLIQCDNPGAVLYVDDLKFGYRLVEVERNWTLLSHAIGFMITSNSFHFQKIVLTIHQPRPYHPDGYIRQWSIGQKELADIRDEIFNAFTTYRDQLKTGDHCYKCLAAAICPALRLATMNVLDVVSDGFDDSLTGEELAFELDMMTRAANLLKVRTKALDEHARAELSSNRTVGPYGMVATVGHSKWLPTVDAGTILALTGVDIEEKSLMTPAAAKRAGVPEEIVSSLTTRPTTGFKLDRVDLNKQAQRAFKTP